MENSHYCVLSQELLTLFQWFCTHKPHLVQEMLSKAWVEGLSKKITSLQDESSLITQESAHDIMINFFTLLETSLTEVEETAALTSDNDSTDQYNESLSNLKINLQGCDHEAFSKTYSDAQAKNKTFASKKAFLKEFLKNWKPKGGIVQ